MNLRIEIGRFGLSVGVGDGAAQDRPGAGEQDSSSSQRAVCRTV